MNYKSREADFSSANTDTEVYKPSTNRAFYMTDIVISNKETGAITVSVFEGSGGEKKIVVTVPGSDSKSVNLSSPVKFLDTVVAQVDSFANGSSITVIGYEE